MQRVTASMFPIPDIAEMSGGADPETIRCDHHGLQYGSVCYVCEIERDRNRKAMFAKCESMGLAPKFHCMRFDGYWTDMPGQIEAVKAAREFIAGEHLVMVFRGSESEKGFGTGKTTLAAIVLYEMLLQKRILGMYSTASRLLAKLKDSIDAKSGNTQQI